MAVAVAALGTLCASTASWASPLPPPTGPPARVDDSVNVLFLGDVMVGRYVGASMAAHSGDAPFRHARPWLSEADLTVANLEGPLVPAGASAIPPPSPSLLNLTGSDAAAGALARAGFDVLSVANNHSLDAREAGLGSTVRALGRVGIALIGRRVGASGGQTAVVRKVRGIRVAFLAYTLVLNTSATMPADRAAAVVAYVRPGVDADVAGVAREVAAARRSADAVAVVVHWGTEYAARPDTAQRRFARALADAGADVVVGAHPHVVQSVEALAPLHWTRSEWPPDYGTRKFWSDGVRAGAPLQPSLPSAARTTLVAYSLGNALFDQLGDASTRRGAALEVVVGPGGVRSARLIPLAIEARATGFAMRPLVDAAVPVDMRRAAAGAAP